MWLSPWSTRLPHGSVIAPRVDWPIFVYCPYQECFRVTVGWSEKIYGDGKSRKQNSAINVAALVHSGIKEGSAFFPILRTPTGAISVIRK